MPLIALAICLCVITAGISLAVFFSSGGSKAGQLAGAGTILPATQAPSAPPTAAITSGPAKSGPKVTRDELAKSVLSWPPRLNHQILRWQAGPGGTALAGIETQMGTAMQAAGIKLYVAMKLACVKLTSGISAAQSGPPIPAHAMERLYARALAGLSHAAADCRAAISVRAVGDETVRTQLNKTLLRRTRLEFAALSKALYRATAAISSLTS